MTKGHIEFVLSGYGVPCTDSLADKLLEMFDGDIAYECSECGELFCLITGTPTDNLYNFCPNCGADLRAESEVKPNE